jgi:MvaI/BcnI restriction endonuclease family
MTKTMLKKGIIDASEDIRLIFRDNGIVNYQTLDQKVYVYYPSKVISNKIHTTKSSFYRPGTKKGDPRFWVYGLAKLASINDLIYFTVYDSHLYAIPLSDETQFEEKIISAFGTNNEDEILEDFKHRIRSIKKKGWVISVSPEKLNDKDIGETLERELGIKINNLKSADFKGQIEVKGKNLKAKTRDSLFSMVPNWSISQVQSVNETALEYGYPDKEYEGYNSLFVTVSHKPNRQGLFLVVDEENELIHQKCIRNGVILDVCSWRFEEVKERLYGKHPKTMWIVAENKKINGDIHFRYLKVQFTHSPIFTEFLLLIKQGIITFDWRRRANTGTGIKLPSSKIDYGQGFRIEPSKRNLLFGETIDLEL